jgi:hypothetical protein
VAGDFLYEDEETNTMLAFGGDRHREFADTTVRPVAESDSHLRST